MRQVKGYWAATTHGLNIFLEFDFGASYSTSGPAFCLSMIVFSPTFAAYIGAKTVLRLTENLGFRLTASR